LGKGTVFKIERCAFHDGPGIRTVVFVKGCPLRCVWCSTPHSQRLSAELQYFEDRCTHCGRCMERCDKEVITRSDEGGVITDRSRCDGCGRCVETCPAGARKIAGQEMSVGQVLDEVEKDRAFYRNTGGGVTLSGGEPTVQAAFSLEILKGCKERSIRAAMETCGYARWHTIGELLPYLDLLYVDIKHMSPGTHRRLTSKSNVPVLRNIERIAAICPDVPMIVRVPVIPGVNDSEENIGATAQFVRRLGPDRKIELLPYHRLGVSNYEALGRKYGMHGVQPPSEDRLRTLDALIRSFGIETLTDT
jgi:pyruvate formate lyase activating enzyme